MSSIFDDVPETQTEARPRGKKFKSVTLPLIGVILLILLTVGGALYIVKVKPEILGLTKNQQEIDKKEVEKYVGLISKLMLLPNEQPTLATVTDLEKVKGQDFFKNAKLGDKVLIYTNAKKAILYRESENKIIEVGVVNVNQQPQQGASQPTGVPTATPGQVSITPQVTPTVTKAPSVTLSPTKNITATPTVTPNP